MLTVRTSENTVITSFRLISERQDFSSVRTGENTVRARARIHLVQTNNLNLKLMQSVLQGNLFLTIRRVPEMDSCHSDLVVRADAAAVKL